MELELEANSHFFMSWLWIGTWLDCFVGDYTVIEAKIENKTVGLGLIVTKSRSLIEKNIKIKHYLHRTGIQSDDQIWIEYNDFMMLKEHARDIRNRMTSYIIKKMGCRHAFIVGASEPDIWGQLDDADAVKREIWKAKNYSRELHPLRESGQSLMDVLSRSARYQIRRSIKKYQQFGDITIERAATKQQAKEFLDIAKPFHVERWGKYAEGSGFTNPKFVLFHHLLIERGLASGVIELNHIKTGEQTIAVIYNFNYLNRIYFYMGAYNYHHLGSQYKPGLVAHYLLIEQSLKTGAKVYDFMGGTARYKATFSDVESSMAIYQIERVSLTLAIESYLRRLKANLIDNR